MLAPLWVSDILGEDRLINQGKAMAISFFYSDQLIFSWLMSVMLMHLCHILMVHGMVINVHCNSLLFNDLIDLNS